MKTKNKTDLRTDPEELKKLADLFAKGHNAAQKDPEKYFTEKRLREDKTPPFHGFDDPDGGEA